MAASYGRYGSRAWRARSHANAPVRVAFGPFAGHSRLVRDPRDQLRFDPSERPQAVGLLDLGPMLDHVLRRSRYSGSTDGSSMPDCSATSSTSSGGTSIGSARSIPNSGHLKRENSDGCGCVAPRRSARGPPRPDKRTASNNLNRPHPQPTRDVHAAGNGRGGAPLRVVLPLLVGSCLWMAWIINTWARWNR